MSRARSVAADALHRKHTARGQWTSRGLLHSRLGTAASSCHATGGRARRGGDPRGCLRALGFGPSGAWAHQPPLSKRWDGETCLRDKAPLAGPQEGAGLRAQGRMVCAQEAVGGGSDQGLEPRRPCTGGRFSLVSRVLVPGTSRAQPRGPGPPATVQRADGTSTRAFRLSNEPGRGRRTGGAGRGAEVRGPKALQPYLPSLERTVAPAVSSRISHMSTNFLMLGKAVSFCLPGQEAESWPQGVHSGARGCPLAPPARPSHGRGS